MPERIVSRKNETVKNAARLTVSASFRREQHLFLAEGARLCFDAAESGVPILILFYTDEAEEKYQKYLEPVKKAAVRSLIIDGQVSAFLSDTKTPQGIFCVCEMPPSEAKLGFSLKSHYLALESIQDPANLGGILRTAEALGVGGVILGGSCCDVYSPKVLRASMGAVFRLPLYPAPDLPEVCRSLRHAGFTTLAAVPEREAIPVTGMDFSKPCVLCIGNEGNGLTPQAIKACVRKVTVPMTGRAESLNASASAAILAWEMMRGGGVGFGD